MIALVLLFFALLRRFWELSRAEDRTVAMAGICGVLLIVGVVARNLTNDFFQRDLALLFWAVAVCSWAMRSTHPARRARRMRKRPTDENLLLQRDGEFHPGRAGNLLLEAGRALARRGHRVSIVAGLGGEPRHRELELLRFPFRREQAWPDLGTRFRRLMERLSFARHSLAHLVSAGYDAVVVNKPFDFPILWQARRRGLAAQTVFRSGGTEFYIGDRYFSGSIDHWLSTSRYNAAQVEARYGRKVAVVHNGVDVDQFKPLARGAQLRQRLPFARRCSRARQRGPAGRWKGLRVILDVLVQLPQDVHYLVVGEGPDEARLREQAAQLGLGGACISAGASRTTNCRRCWRRRTCCCSLRWARSPSASPWSRPWPARCRCWPRAKEA